MHLSFAFRRLGYVSALALLAGCMAAREEPVFVAEDSAPEVAGVFGGDAVTVEPMYDAEVVAEAPASGSYAGVARRGVVTAGDIDDRLNLTALNRYLKGAKLGLPQLGLGTPVIVRLTGPRGDSSAGARYTLRKPGAAEPFHEGYAGPDGRIVDFPKLLGGGDLSKVELRVFGEDGQEIGRQVVQAGSATNIRLMESARWDPDFLDLVLVVDTTGSMGDEIAFLQKELIGVTKAAARQAPGVSIRYGLVAYRDHGDEYVVRNYGFTSSSSTMAGWLRGLSADGGGDYPEAAAAALRAGVGLDWRRGKGERLLLHVADAPPHDGQAAEYLRAAKAAAEAGVQIFTLGASGVAEESEFLMRQASVATGGRYLFLTDDSGVGNAHAEPTIACYQVTKLSQLLARVLATELSGVRQEASEVIREVGSYRRGVCRD
jgi:Mg-chelatase subunit ChlD